MPTRIEHGGSIDVRAEHFGADKQVEWEWEVRLNGQETWLNHREALGQLERLAPKEIVEVSQARRGDSSA